MNSKYFQNKVITFLGAISIAPILMTSLTSCSNTQQKTINPFSSSFEESDPIASNNQAYISSSGISDLITNSASGPTSGYNLNAHTSESQSYGFNGLKSFGYSATTDNTTNPFFCNYLYQDLNIKIGQESELSYKVFPILGDESINNVEDRYISSYVAIDLLYTDNNQGSTPLQRLSLNPRVIDQNGYHLDAYSQGTSKTLYCNQ
jgi:hypothetical protein